jgi:hypothetical protein
MVNMNRIKRHGKNRLNFNGNLHLSVKAKISGRESQGKRNRKPGSNKRPAASCEAAGESG